MVLVPMVMVGLHLKNVVPGTVVMMVLIVYIQKEVIRLIHAGPLI